ncbi:MAG: TlpA disulfide reductase family protein [Opitutaceae bacterium]
MKRLLQYSSLFVFIAVLVVLAQRGAASSGDGPAEEIGGVAPAWELPLIGGGTFNSSDLAGKIVVIDFWATWCPPCRAEVPDYVEMQEAYREKGLVIVGISFDEGANAEARVAKFMEDYKINYPVVMGDYAVAEAFGGILAFPTTFVVDREGRLVHRKVGYKPKSYLEEIISGLL